MRTEHHRGFTLVELLVVIAIIGALVALLLPAIQAARESARRSQCVNNLKQVALAIDLYHDMKQVYPPGRLHTDQYGESWAFRLLPQLEQQAIFDAFDVKLRVDDAKNAQAMRTPVSTFYCPTRRSPAADRDFDNGGTQSLVPAAAAGGDYAANAGIYHNFETPPELGGPDDPHLDAGRTAGPIYTYSKIAARHVTDGLSNTFAVGERHLPSPDVFDEPEILHLRQGDTAYFAADTAATILRGTKWGLATGPQDADVTKFGSEHTGLVHFAFLDGHVASVTDDVDIKLLQQMSVIGDGGDIAQDVLDLDL